MSTTIYEVSGSGSLIDILESEDDEIFQSVRRKGYSLPIDFIARHKGAFVAYSEGEAEVPSARFSDLRQAGKHLFEIQKEKNGTYTIKNVPIYKAHPDTRKYGVNINRSFIDRMVKNFYSTVNATAQLFGSKEFSWRPKLHYGHTPNDDDAPERNNVAFIDNLYRVEDFLFGDYIGLDKHTLDELISGKYPDRSAEVDLRRARLLSVAALGFRTPHFALPQMTPQQLRHRYLAAVSKNSAGIKEIEHHILLEKDFEMAGKTAVKKAKNSQVEFDLTPEIITKFFMKKDTDEALQQAFDEAVSKHCDMFGAMPQGGGILQIIQQLMQQMASRSMNQPAGMAGQSQGGSGGQQGQQEGYGKSMNASDLLDLEVAHHSADGDNEMEEEGTEESDQDGASEDASVDDDGTPAVEGKDEDTVSTSGTVTKQKFGASIERVKHSISRIKDVHLRDQLSAVMNEMHGTVESLADLVDVQHAGITKLTKEFQVQKNARRKSEYNARLERMFSNQNPNVANQQMISKHLKFALTLSEEAGKTYLDNLEEAAASAPRRVVSKNEVIDREDDESDRMVRAKNTIQSNSTLRRAGVTPEHLAALDMVDELLGN